MDEAKLASTSFPTSPRSWLCPFLWNDIGISSSEISIWFTLGHNFVLKSHFYSYPRVISRNFMKLHRDLNATSKRILTHCVLLRKYRHSRLFCKANRSMRLKICTIWSIFEKNPAFVYYVICMYRNQFFVSLWLFLLFCSDFWIYVGTYLLFSMYPDTSYLYISLTALAEGVALIR